VGEGGGGGGGGGGGDGERERECASVCWRLSCLLSTTGVADICERTAGPIFHVL